MACLEEVAFKIPLGALEEVQEEVQPISAPEISVPDYLKLLQETEYAFSLENWVLTGLQGGYPSEPPSPLPPGLASGAPPSCPPYWMMFSSPQESRLASRWSSDFWEPDPRPRSRSLNAAHLRSMNDRVKFADSDSDDGYSGNGYSDNGLSDDGYSDCPGETRPSKKSQTTGPSSNFLNLPSHNFLPQRRRNHRQSSLSFQNPPRASLQRSLTSVGQNRQASTSSAQNPERHQRAAALPQSLRQRAVPPVAARPLGSHGTTADSSMELLSALSPEERELLQAITEQGYPLHTAIIALQRTGQQSPEQILSYLVACDRLCELGYDEAQVEEALEMFQNCETKAEEFLHLLTQFNEMGFQQSAIKEVLLVHENHRERALEELMMRVA